MPSKVPDAEECDATKLPSKSIAKYIKMIYRSKAPLRIGLAGGGTDVSPYSDLYGGAILNATISLYANATIELLQENKIILETNDRGEIEIFNVSAQRLFGYNENEVIGKLINFFLAEEFSEGHLSNYKELGNSHIIGRNAETIAIHKDGGQFPVEVCITITENSGRTSFIFVIRDITERKKAEERINQYTDRVEWAYFETQNARS